jgi:hypothetical protein
VRCEFHSHNNNASAADDDDENYKHEAHETVDVIKLVVPKGREHKVPKTNDKNVKPVVNYRSHAYISMKMLPNDRDPASRSTTGNGTRQFLAGISLGTTLTRQGGSYWSVQ